MQLAKGPELQRFAVDAGLVHRRDHRLRRRLPTGERISDRLDIGEVTFWERTRLTDLD